MRAHQPRPKLIPRCFRSVREEVFEIYFFLGLLGISFEAPIQIFTIRSLPKEHEVSLLPSIKDLFLLVSSILLEIDHS